MHGSTPESGCQAPHHAAQSADSDPEARFESTGSTSHPPPTWNAPSAQALIFIAPRRNLQWKYGTAKTAGMDVQCVAITSPIDRKSTRLNSSHLVISYAVFCLKK